MLLPSLRLPFPVRMNRVPNININDGKERTIGQILFRQFMDIFEEHPELGINPQEFRKAVKKDHPEDVDDLADNELS